LQTFHYMSYEEEDTGHMRMSYKEEGTCHMRRRCTYIADLPLYEEEDTCHMRMSYEEEDTCHMRRGCTYNADVPLSGLTMLARLLQTAKTLSLPLVTF
jgi:hypothetical protein